MNMVILTTIMMPVNHGEGTPRFLPHGRVETPGHAIHRLGGFSQIALQQEESFLSV